MPTRFMAPVIAKRTYPYATELVLRVPDDFRAQPGQFIQVHCGSDAGRILRRPYSLYQAQEGQASLLVKVVGSGSAWLGDREVGDSLDCLGPLGRGFRLPSTPGNGINILVAGGIGIAPLHFLGRRMRALDVGARIYWGMERGEGYQGLLELMAQDMEIYPASRDGGIGFEGGVLDLVEADAPASCAGVYACGPKGMLVDLAEIIDKRGYGVFQVSLEERMACGVGACRGCVVPSAVPGGHYLAVCRDGPVFDGRELDWKRIRQSICK